jgi:hypothetical protein
MRVLWTDCLKVRATNVRDVLRLCRLSSQRRVVHGNKMQVNVTEATDRTAGRVLNMYLDRQAFKAESQTFDNETLRPAMLHMLSVVHPQQLEHTDMPVPLGEQAFPPVIVTQRGLTLNGIVHSQHPDFIASLQVCI